MVRPIQKILLGLIALLLCLPLPAMLLLRGKASFPPWLLWIGNRTLSGVTVHQDSPPLSLTAWFRGKYQEGVANQINENFGGRELLIRAHNQSLWSVFGKSYMMDEMIVRGKHDDLFSSDYLAFREGFAAVPSNDYLRELAIESAELQRRLAVGGTAFAVLVTPDKPSFYAQDVPARYHPRVPGSVAPPPDADQLIAALAREKVHYTDGRSVTRDLAARVSWPTFPRTGVHWNRLTAFYTTVALLDNLTRSYGRPFPQLAATNIRRQSTPVPPDADLALLLNLIWMPADQYVNADYSSTGKSPGTITFVGGSFADALDVILDDTRAFRRINHYHYFKVNVQRFPGASIEPVDEEHIPWQDDFLSAQAVVLEINPMYVTGRHPLAFLDAALAATRSARRVVAGAGVVVSFDTPDWFGPETGGLNHWQWAKGPASITLTNPGSIPCNIQLKFALGVLSDRTVRLLGPDGAELRMIKVEAHNVTPVTPVHLRLNPGDTVLRFKSDQPAASPVGQDLRRLDFQVFDLEAADAD